MYRGTLSGKDYDNWLEPITQRRTTSPHAKWEAYWTKLQRAYESLREDLPTGLGPTPLGTEKSVVSNMPPNEMHTLIQLTICTHLAWHVMEMLEQK